MPNYVRWRSRGATYFFTVVTDQRRPLFADAGARRHLRRSMVEVRARRPFEMSACVLLPDHLHCLWTLPENDDDFPIRWANIKRLFTVRYVKNGGFALPVSANRAKHREVGVWQPRYWEHRIRDEVDLYRHRDYIHLNPVRHGFVAEPRQWPWSSFHRHVRLGLLDPNWPGSSAIDELEVPGDA
jgi:putative transposase